MVRVETNTRANAQGRKLKLERTNHKGKSRKLSLILEYLKDHSTAIIALAVGIATIGGGVALYNGAKTPHIDAPISSIIDYNADHLYVDELQDRPSVQNYIMLCDSIAICDSIDELNIDYNKIYNSLSEEQMLELNGYTLNDVNSLIEQYNESKNSLEAAKLYYLRNASHTFVETRGTGILESFLLTYIKSNTAYALNLSPDAVDNMTIQAKPSDVQDFDSIVLTYNETGSILDGEYYNLSDELYDLCLDLYNIQDSSKLSYSKVSNYVNEINYSMFFESEQKTKKEFWIFGSEHTYIDLDNSKTNYKRF